MSSMTRTTSIVPLPIIEFIMSIHRSIMLLPVIVTTSWLPTPLIDIAG
jgi:hypothetical protein